MGCGDQDWRSTSGAATRRDHHGAGCSIAPEINGKLLILGNPGSGKTTTMLDLAKVLIDRATAQPDLPIPVLFNLSGWKDDRLIRDWLTARVAG